MSVSALRIRAALALAVVVPLGFGLKLYAGPGRGWINNGAAGIAYEVFWCLAIFLLWPRRAAVNRIALGVLLGTGALEILQLWHPPLLEAIRCTFPGRALIGTTFTWWDFPCYAAGSGLGWWLLRTLSAPAARGTDSSTMPPT